MPRRSCLAFDDVGKRDKFSGMEKTVDNSSAEPAAAVASLETLERRAEGWCRDGIVGGSALVETPLDKKNVFPEGARNAGRLDPMGWAVCAAVSAALRSVELLERNGEKLPVAIYFSCPEGSIPADAAYFDDYLAFDETGGRANMFVHTLPSSPIGEASVRFGLTGETMFFATSENVVEAMTRFAETAAAIRGEKLFLVGTGRHTGTNSADASFILLAAR